VRWWPATPSPGSRLGHARYLLPARRPTRLLGAKLIALIVYTLSAVILVAVTAYLTGSPCSARSRSAATPGGLTTSNIAATSLSGSGLSRRHRAADDRAVAFIAVSMLGVGAIALSYPPSRLGPGAALARWPR